MSISMSMSIVHPSKLSSLNWTAYLAYWDNYRDPINLACMKAHKKLQNRKTIQIVHQHNHNDFNADEEKEMRKLITILVIVTW